MAVDRPTEEERLALCQWLTENDIDPNIVPLREADIRIDEKNGQRVILYTEFVRDELTGNILADPDNRQAITSSASAPCLVEPPEWLRVPGAKGEGL